LQHLPTISGGIILAHEGALMAYGVGEEDTTRRAAIYIDVIFPSNTRSQTPPGSNGAGKRQA
jgi:hypothetical protein